MLHACLPQMALSLRVRAASSHRTTASPTRKRDSATGPTRALVNAVHVDHSWTLNSNMGGLKLADPRLTTEPRGLAEARSRPADLFTSAAVPERSAALDVCVAQHRQLSIVKSCTTDKKYQTFWLRASSIALWFGQRTVDNTQQSPEPCNTQQTTAATVSKGQPNASITDGSTKFK